MTIILIYCIIENFLHPTPAIKFSKIFQPPVYSIWEEDFTKVKENNFYYVTNMKKRNFNGICLTTQRFTEFSESEPFEIVNCCVEGNYILSWNHNGSVNVYQICNNPVAKNYAVLVREGYI